ncbi:MAG: lysozyme, partial [bacterium]
MEFTYERMQRATARLEANPHDWATLMNPFYLDAIKRFEGFTEQSQWDYAQNSNGFGTRALYPGEVIDRAEAERRFRNEVATARAVVERHAPNADEGTKAALTSLTFNAGMKWVQDGLGDAVRKGDLETVRELFQSYNRAGGKELQGLVSRRSVEAEWIGNPALAGAVPGPVDNAAQLQSTLPCDEGSATNLTQVAEVDAEASSRLIQ